MVASDEVFVFQGGHRDIFKTRYVLPGDALVVKNPSGTQGMFTIGSETLKCSFKQLPTPGTTDAPAAAAGSS